MKPEKKKIAHKNTVKGFQVVRDECIWMRAGVVNFKLCDNAFDCYHCAFDKGMRRTLNTRRQPVAANQAPSWADALRRKYDGAARPCRHALTGRVDAPKICAMNYECYHCAYDQLLDEMDMTDLENAPRCTSASGFRVADGYYYHPGHSWARFEHGGRVRVGIDDFFARVFGILDELHLPPLGTDLVQNQAGWSVNRQNHKAAVLSPITGTVLAVNHKVLDRPQVSHADPFHEGWLAILEPQTPRRNLKSLYFGSESIAWTEAESRRLLELLGPEYSQMAATGARLVDDVFGSLPQIGWDRLVASFLHT